MADNNKSSSDSARAAADANRSAADIAKSAAEIAKVSANSAKAAAEVGKTVSHAATDITKALTPLYRELDTLSKSVRHASENLSNAGLDKLAEQIKSAVKASGLYEDEVLHGMKSFKDLAHVLSDMEEQYNKIRKHEIKARELALDDMKGISKESKNYEQNLTVGIQKHKEILVLNDKELQLTAAQIKAIQEHYPVIKAETEARLKSIESSDRLVKAHEGLRESITKQINGFASLATSAKLLNKAFWNSYDQLNRLTNKGMLGAFATINELSWQLRVTNQEFEELINKNRDLVNQMGGGIKGIESFATELGNVRKDLEYLGRDATKAAERLIKMSQRSGLSPKDGLLYRKNMNESIAQFKRFSGVFGDSADDYANLTEGMTEEATMRGRLNTMSKSELALFQQELRARTENLKFMGLQNQQIVEVNKTMNQLVNPEENDFAQRGKETVSAQAGYDETIKLLQRMGKDDEAQRMMNNRETFAEMMRLTRAGMQEEAAALATSEKGMEANKAFELGVQTSNRSFGDPDAQYARATRNKLLKEGGGTVQKLRSGGEMAATAESKGLYTAKEDRAARIAEAEKLTAANSALAAALAKATDAVQMFNSLIGNPFVQAFGGLIAGIWGLSKAFSAIKAVAGMFGKSIGGAAGVAKGAFGLLKSFAGGFARVLVALGLDKLLGVTGLAGGNTIDEGQDETNWGQMTLGEKFQSGAARGIEKAGSFLGLGNITNSAKASRISGETDYLKSQGRASAASNPGVAVQPGGTSGTSTMPFNFDSYAEHVGQRENGGKYTGTNSYGYAGKYQMGAEALESVGILKSGTSKMGNRAMNDPSNWTTPGGLQGFLSDPQLQESAFKAFTNLNYATLMKAGVLTSSSSPTEIAGFLAAAHLKGVGGAIKLKNGQSTADANGTQTSNYFAEGVSSQNTSPSQGGDPNSQYARASTLFQAGDPNSQYARADKNVARKNGGRSYSGLVTTESGVPVVPVQSAPYSNAANATTTTTNNQQNTTQNPVTATNTPASPNVNSVPFTNGVIRPINASMIGSNNTATTATTTAQQTADQTQQKQAKPEDQKPTAPVVATVDPAAEELKKQTTLLSQIVKNTATKDSISARSDSWAQSLGVVMGGT